MEVTKEELKRLIQQGIKEELAERHRPRTVSGWLRLRKEIDEYCQSQKDGQVPGKARAYGTIQNSIYLPIKTTLGLYRIDEMSEQEVPIAKEIFEFIKKERAKAQKLAKEKEHNYRK